MKLEELLRAEDPAILAEARERELRRNQRTVRHIGTPHPDPAPTRTLGVAVLAPLVACALRGRVEPPPAA